MHGKSERRSKLKDASKSEGVKFAWFHGDLYERFVQGLCYLAVVVMFACILNLFGVH